MTYYYGAEYSYAISHHGVKGQKWGVRRYQHEDGIRTALGKRREQQANKQISEINKLRERNKNQLKVNKADIDSGGGTKKMKAKAKRYQDYAFDDSETVNKYRIARQKAKKNKNYKNSKEYLSARNKFRKQVIQQGVLGQSGSYRVRDLQKTKGYSEKQATGRVVAEQLAIGVALSAVSIGLTLSSNRY